MAKAMKKKAHPVICELTASCIATFKAPTPRQSMTVLKSPQTKQRPTPNVNHFPSKSSFFIAVLILVLKNWAAFRRGFILSVELRRCDISAVATSKEPPTFHTCYSCSAAPTYGISLPLRLAVVNLLLLMNLFLQPQPSSIVSR